MWRTVGYVLVLIGMTLIREAIAQNDGPAFAKFKSEMMPKVGHKITVVGTLHDGKDGFWLAFKDWGVYIRAAKEPGLTRENDLFVRFPPKGQTVEVTGILRYFPKPARTGKEKFGRAVQTAPEHFFFDAGTVRMSLWSPRAPANPNK